MTDERFDIQFCGEVQPGKEREAVKQAMAAIFRLNPGQVARLFCGERFTVARGLDDARAQKIRTAIEQAGGVCTLVPSAAPPSPAATASAVPPPPGPLPQPDAETATLQKENGSAFPETGQASPQMQQPPPAPRKIPPTRAAPESIPDPPERKGLPLSLMVGIPVALVLVVLVIIRILPHNPPRSELLQIMNERIAALQVWTGVIQDYPDIRALDSRDSSGNVSSTFTSQEFSILARDMTAGSGERPIQALARTLNEANLREKATDGNQRIEDALKKLEKDARKYSKEYQAVVKDIRDFQNGCNTFADLALAPEKAPGIVQYSIAYRTGKLKILSAYDTILSKISKLKSRDSDGEKGRIKAEVERSKELLEAWKD